MNKLYSSIAEAEAAYNQYLTEHIYNVQRAFAQTKQKLGEILPPSVLSYAAFVVQHHDASKFSTIEFDAYRKNFYPSKEDSEGVQRYAEIIEDGADVSNKLRQQALDQKVAYDTAWIHHAHSNKHHPEYWHTVDREDGMLSVPMDTSSVIEMLCDWHSFSAKNPESTAYYWWENNSEYFRGVLHPDTVIVVEELISCFNEPLPAEEIK